MKKISEHPSMTESSYIKMLCEPLLHLNISYFAHVRIDGENRFSALTNNPGFHEHYLHNQYYNADIHLAKREDLGKYIIWDSLSCTGETEKMNQEAVEFGLRHTFTIVEKQGKNKDYYHFSTHIPNPAINQTYLENIDLLKLFILSFQEKTAESRILSNAYNIHYSIDEDLSDFTSNTKRYNRQKFLEKIQLSLPEIISEISLRELEILSWLHRGKTQAEIAELLGIKEITIKKHLENIRKKTRCYTQFQLGEYFASLISECF